MMQPSRRPGLSRLVLGLALAGAARPGAAAPVSSTPLVGGWTLALEDGSRQCRLALRADALGEGHAVGMPAGCHKAFPALGPVAVWTEPAEGRVRLETASGEPVVSFEAASSGVLTGAGPQGSLYRLEPVGEHKSIALRMAAAAKPAEAGPAVGQTAPRLTPALKPPEVAGHYAVLRDKARDTGCMVTLDEKAHGPKGTLKANLAPACRDQGIVIFDPVGWQIVGGRLVLTARKGHTAKFDIQDDGTWLKDPKDGKSLGLKRI